MKNGAFLVGLPIALLIAGMALGGAAFGEAPAPAKLALCVACHGTDGIGRDPSWPNLAGQKKTYLVTQLKAFRDGKIDSATMLPLVVELTDDDIEQLAEYYSHLECPSP